jgi:DNA-binding response OmpR family regulator
MTDFRTREEELAYLRRRNRELEDHVEELKYQIECQHEIEEFESIAIMETLKIPLGQARILRLLASGQPYTRERLIEEYASDFDYELRNVDSQIKRIRKTVEDIPIKSIYGYGYQMEPAGVKRIKQLIVIAKQKQKEAVAAKVESKN